MRKIAVAAATCVALAFPAAAAAETVVSRPVDVPGNSARTVEVDCPDGLSAVNGGITRVVGDPLWVTGNALAAGRGRLSGWVVTVGSHRNVSFTAWVDCE